MDTSDVNNIISALNRIANALDALAAEPRRQQDYLGSAISSVIEDYKAGSL